MKIKLGDEAWLIKLVPPEEFVSTHGEEFEGTAALTDLEKKEIHFRTDEIDIEYVRHELFHAYFNLLMLKDIELKKDDTEEMSANVIGKYGEELIKNSKKIIKYLLKLNPKTPTI